MKHHIPCATTTTRLIPVTGTKVKGLTSPHVIHDILNVPGLVLVTRWVVWWHALVLIEANVLLHTVNNSVEVLVDVVLGIVAPNPAGHLGLSTARVELDLLPVGLLEELGVAETQLLGASITDESVEKTVSSFLS